MTQFVQPVLTTDQTARVSDLLQLVLDRAEELGIVWNEGEDDQVAQLAGFFQAVTDEPTKFRPTGKAATSVRSIVRGLKGPAQPQSRRNKRKARQEKRQGGHKRRRAEQGQLVADFNAARERIEADMKEMEEAYREELTRKTEQIDSILRSNTDPKMVELLRLIGADAAAEHAATFLEGAEAKQVLPPNHLDGQIDIDAAIELAEQE